MAAFDERIKKELEGLMDTAPDTIFWAKLAIIAVRVLAKIAQEMIDRA
jgi:hypothetical protein